jgi:uncharacterized membrane protein YphA (DoxX/SURF4 family)
LPGVGLLLLRTAVGVTLVVQGVAHLGSAQAPRLSAWTIGLLGIASGVALLIGFATPIAGALAVLGVESSVLSWLPTLHLSGLGDTLPIVFVTVMTVAVVLVGPGAFSIDARLFGRREIVIPRAPRPPRSRL